MYLLLIFLPLIGSFCAGLFGRKLGPSGAAYITVSCLVLAFSISFFAFYKVSLLNCCVYIKLASWINSEMLNVDWGFLFDSLTVVMCCVVTFVSSIVYLYSTEHMAQDPHLPRFMSYLSLFTFFMLILVTADNFIQMFVGWEGVGLCSYLLSNLIGLIPYSFTATSHLIVTFTMSSSIFIGINIICIQRHKFRMFSFFIPANTSFGLALLLVPIELISYIFRPISLGVRLFANLMAGHALLKVIVGFSWSMLLLEGFLAVFHIIPLLILVSLMGLELGVALIQAYVFTIVMCIYLNDALKLH